MPASPEKIAANRRNAKKSSGPKTPEGKQRSRNNALTHGLTGVGVALPDAIARRAAEYEAWLRVDHGVDENDEVGRFLVGQAALAMARMDVCPEVEFGQLREQIARAESSWELDREVDAALLGDKLAKKPAVVSLQLLETSQGIDWLIERWSFLARWIEAAGEVDEKAREILADLLGIPAEFRGSAWDLRPGRPTSEVVALARARIAKFTRMKAEILIPRDERDRDTARAGLAFDTTAPARRLRGYEAACDRRLRWATDQLERRRRARSGGEVPTPPPSRLPWPTRDTLEPSSAPASAPEPLPTPPTSGPEPAPTPPSPRSEPRFEKRTQPDGTSSPGMRSAEDSSPSPAIDPRSSPSPILNRRARRAAAKRSRRSRGRGSPAQPNGEDQRARSVPGRSQRNVDGSTLARLSGPNVENTEFQGLTFLEDTGT